MNGSIGVIGREVVRHSSPGDKKLSQSSDLTKILILGAGQRRCQAWAFVSLFLTEWFLFSLDSFLVSAALYFSEGYCFFIFRDGIYPELLKIEDPSNEDVTPLNHPSLRFG